MDGLDFQIGSLIFFSAVLSGVLVLYACDGPKIVSKAVLTVGVIGLLVPLAVSSLGFLGAMADMPWAESMAIKEPRVLAAGALSTVFDLVLLAMAWELLGKHLRKLHLFFKVSLALFSVMLMDTILFTWWAYAGSASFMPVFKGGLIGRLVLALIWSPLLWLYLRHQQNPYESSLRSGSVFELWFELADMAGQLWMSRKELNLRAWTEKEQQHNETTLALAIEASGAGVYGIGSSREEGVVVDRNWAAMFGYRLDELPPKEDIFDWWVQCIHPQDRERIQKRYQAFINGVTTEYKTEYRMRTKHGDYIYVLSMARAMETDSDGKVISLAGILTDITQHRSWQNTLQVSRRHLKQIIDSLPDAILVIDTAGKVIQWNKAMEELTGVPANQMLGKGDYEYAVPFYGYRRPMLADIALDKDLAKSLDQVNLNQEAMGGISAEIFHQNMGQVGSYLWSIARPLYDDEGKETGAIQSIRDVTQRRADQQDREDLINRLQATQENLRRLSLLDSLTGLANRRHFEQAIQLEVRRALREDQPLGLVMCDLDYFKNFNDTYGHQAGDDCLRKVAQAIKRSLKRPGDLAARYGGEEFVVLLPNTGPHGSMLVAKAMQEAVEELNLPHESSLAGSHLTISLGVANTEYGIALDEQLLVAAADQGLYLAKDRGRNQIVEAMPPIQARLKQIT